MLTSAMLRRWASGRLWTSGGVMRPSSIRGKHSDPSLNAINFSSPITLATVTSAV
jgi:hypothetical protein